MKCPQCGLVTFDDLPQCPRCEESFALVRPLASASLDGARHLLRDDPELRVKLRDRLHRARLDRRKDNKNPLAAGLDPDAPDWFEPLPGDDGRPAEAVFAIAPDPGGRSEETTIVYSDDLSTDDEVRGAATTADAETETELASAEPLSVDEQPDFEGDIPGFSDWREELRERLKRIRARREQERLAGDEDPPDDELAAEAPTDEELGAEADEELGAEVDEELTAEADEELTAEVDEELAAEAVVDIAVEAVEEPAVEVVDEPPADDDVAPRVEIVGFGAAITDPGDEVQEPVEAVEPAEPVATAGDLIAQIVDGPGAAPDELDVELESATEADEQAVDFTIDQMPGADVIDLDLDLGAEDAEAEAADTETDTEDSGAADLEIIDLDELLAEPPTEDALEDLLIEEEAPIDASAADPEGEAHPQDDTPQLSTGERVAQLDAIFENAPEVDVGEEDEAAENHAPAEEDDAPAEIEAAEDLVAEDEATEDAAAQDEVAEDEATEDAAAQDEVAKDEAAQDEATEDDAPALDLPPAIMPELPDEDEAAADDSRGTDDLLDVDAAGPDERDEEVVGTGDAPELEFDDAEAVVPAASLELDLPDAEPEEDRALEWDQEAEPARPVSSAGPLGERAAAVLCDTLVLTAIGAALVGAAASGTGLPFLLVLTEHALWLGVTWAIFAIGYSVFFVGSCGQTIGRMVMRLRVVGTDQFSVGFGSAAIRLAVWIASALPLLAGMIPALKDPQNRALHDRLSNTRVVKA